jgi:tRNA(Ile)-lysidine synthase
MLQPKKVARFMLDAQIPTAWRERIPLLCNPQQVLWLAGWRIDERVKVTPQSQHVLKVRLTKT